MSAIKAFIDELRSAAEGHELEFTIRVKPLVEKPTKTNATTTEEQQGSQQSVPPEMVPEMVKKTIKQFLSECTERATGLTQNPSAFYRRFLSYSGLNHVSRKIFYALMEQLGERMVAIQRKDGAYERYFERRLLPASKTQQNRHGRAQRSKKSTLKHQLFLEQMKGPHRLTTYGLKGDITRDYGFKKDSNTMKLLKYLRAENKALTRSEIEAFMHRSSAPVSRLLDKGIIERVFN